MILKIISKHLKRLDLRSLGILLVIGTLILNYIKMEDNCLAYFNKRKLPIGFNSMNSTRNDPVIFIGGVPRSGSTLLGFVMSANPLISWKPVNFISNSLTSFWSWHNSSVEKMRLEHAGVKIKTIESAVSSFVLEIISNKNKPIEKIHCVSDSFSLGHAQYLSKLFPKSKFILTVRDARSNVFSISRSHASVPGFSDKNILKAFTAWNRYNEMMYNECMYVGKNRCLLVYYEQLVLQPQYELKRIFKFLNIKWNDAVLNHEKNFINSIKVSKKMKKPLNLEDLYSWIGNIPENAFAQLDLSMMSKLGYDIKSKKPDYQKIRNRNI